MYLVVLLFVVVVIEVECVEFNNTTLEESSMMKCLESARADGEGYIVTETTTGARTQASTTAVFPDELLLWIKSHFNAEEHVNVCVTLNNETSSDQAMREISCALPLAVEESVGNCSHSSLVYEEMIVEQVGWKRGKINDLLCSCYYKDKCFGFSKELAKKRFENNYMSLSQGQILIQRLQCPNDRIMWREKWPSKCASLLGVPDEVLYNTEVSVFHAVAGDKVQNSGARTWIEVEPISTDTPIYLCLDEDANGILEDRKKQYAMRHGYGVIRQSRTDGQSTRLHLLYESVQVMRPKGWALWMDSNVFITNMDVKIETLLATGMAKSEALIMVAAAGKIEPLLMEMERERQYNVVVDGDVVLCSSNASTLLHSALRVAKIHNLTSRNVLQQTFSYMFLRGQKYEEFEFWRNKMILLPQRQLLSFPEDDGEKGLEIGFWRSGDFSISLKQTPESTADVARLMLEIESNVRKPAKLRVSSSVLVSPLDGEVMPEFSASLDTYFNCSETMFAVLDPPFYPNDVDPIGRYPLNPSCVWQEGKSGLFCVVRTVNYLLDLVRIRQHYFPSILHFYKENALYVWPPRTPGRTFDYFFNISLENVFRGGDVTVNSEEMVIEEKVQSQILSKVTIAYGFEDVKLVRYNGTLFGTCTTLQMNRQGRCETGWMTFEGKRLTDIEMVRGWR